MSAAARADSRIPRAWEVLGTVLDPEVPALSVRDLGLVRDVQARGDELEIVLTPTYSGCPATELIERKFRIYGLGDPPELQKFVCGKKLYNYDNLEPSERKLVL